MDSQASRQIDDGHPRLGKSYQLARDPPLPMPADVYLDHVRAEWQTLLDSPAAREERSLQLFLEQHPSLLPGPRGLDKPYSGHAPFPAAVITQPDLRGLRTRRPDFMWLSQDSGTIEPVLIEIETPHKRWFTAAGHPTAVFTQAQDQLTDWKAWFSEPENVALFRRMYGVPPSTIEPKAFHVQYVLIFGSSRRGIGGRPEDNSKRIQLQRADELYMTFDRLAPSADALQWMTVRLTDGRYDAVAIPPTLKLGPLYAEERAHISGKEAAAERCAWASPERCAFLAARFAYWDAWARKGARGWYQSADWE